MLLRKYCCVGIFAKMFLRFSHSVNFVIKNVFSYFFRNVLRCVSRYVWRYVSRYASRYVSRCIFPCIWPCILPCIFCCVFYSFSPAEESLGLRDFSPGLPRRQTRKSFQAKASEEPQDIFSIVFKKRSCHPNGRQINMLKTC